MGGYHGDHSPADLKGLLEFARSLSQPEVFDVLSQAELLSPIARYRIPTARRRYYSRMARFPDGLLPIGNSICTFHPAFAQGMTAAALEAETIGKSLDLTRNLLLLRLEYFRRADAIINVPGERCSGENFKYPQTTGRRPFGIPVTQRYKDLLATRGHPGGVRDFHRALALTAPPKILLRSRIMMRALARSYVFTPAPR